MRNSLCVMAAVVMLAGGAITRAEFDVKVDLENVSGQAKTNWPVILTVMQVFGRDLPAGAINPKGFHVFDASGQEVQWCLEELPPHIHPGGYELVFVIPSMDKGAKATYRITNTASEGKAARIDVVGNPNNLIASGGFEGSDADASKLWSGAHKIDTEARHSGGASFLLAGRSGMKAGYTGEIPLHKDSYYYAAVWSKTENIARHGTAAGAGGNFKMTGLEPQNGAAASLAPTCYTRDWNKLRLAGRYSLFRGDWGIEGNTIKAVDDKMTLEIALDQKRQFWMENDGSGKWWLDDLVLLEQPKVTVRHDLSVEPLMKDGYFLFTRPTNAAIGDAPAEATKDRKKAWGWCPLPFPHEAVSRIDRFALKGQRANYLVGLYHARAMEKVSLKVEGDALVAPDGAKLAPESIEYSYGVLGEAPHYYLIPQTEPVSFAGPKGQRYFLVTFRVPRDAKSGKYAGKLVVTEGDKTLKAIPVTLAVQDMEQPVLKDRYIGSIFQSAPMVFTEETITVFGRQGFSCVTIFGGFLKFKQGTDGLTHVDFDDLAVKMGWLMKNGFAAVSLYSDLQLDDKPRGPGRMAGIAYKEAAADKDAAGAKAALDAAVAARKKAAEELAAAKQAAAAESAGAAEKQAVAEKDKALKDAAAKETAAAAANEAFFKKAYGRQILELAAECRKHPDWPTLIHMNWDEPGGPNPKMGYTNEFLPDALTTADLGFGVIPSCAKHYTIPCIDDPADYSGPDLYGWIKKQGKKIGIAASARKDEFARYQVGLLVAGADITYLHSWHVEGLMSMQPVPLGGKTRKCLRSIGLVGAGEGMDDLKMVTLLRQAIAGARSGGDSAAKDKADQADRFLAETFKVFNGDHAQASGNPPWFGMPGYWGYDRYYDDFQRKCGQYAAALLGTRWVE